MYTQDKLHTKGLEPVVLTREQCDAVREEMSRIFADSTFRTSKRCQILLHCLVEHALAGNLDSIKERTLGAEVFGRDAGYDNVADPVVRMTASEIRKRLAQWYLDSNLPHQVKIRLVAGSYLPEFHFESEEPTTPPPLNTNNATEAAKPTPAATSQLSIREIFRLQRWPAGRSLVAAALLLLVAAGLVGTLYFLQVFRSTGYLVWKPLLDSQQTLTICVSDYDTLVLKQIDGITQSQIIAKMIASRRVIPTNTEPNPAAVTPLMDADVATKLAAWMGSHDRHILLRPSSVLSLRDFRQGPAILIGGFSNPWTLILLSSLRYSLRMDAETREMWVLDAQNPSQRRWKVGKKNDAGAEVAYALVTRFLDPETDQWLMALGGLGPYGTQVAGELLTDSAYTHLLPAALRSSHNFQMVVKTTIINGNAGPPEVVAVHTW